MSWLTDAANKMRSRIAAAARERRLRSLTTRQLQLEIEFAFEDLDRQNGAPAGTYDPTQEKETFA